MPKASDFHVILCQCCSSLALLGERCDCTDGSHDTDLLSQLAGCRMDFADDSIAIGGYVCDGCLTPNSRWALKAEVLFV